MFSRSVDNFLLSLADFFGNPASHFCRLESATKDFLIADDGSMVSFFEIKGTIQVVGNDEFNDIVEHISSSLAGYLTEKGHALQFVFERDPQSALEQVQEHFEQMKNTSRLLGMNIDGVIDSHAETIAKYTAVEKNIIALWTYPYVLPKQIEKNARKKSLKEKLPPAAHGMSLRYMKELAEEHVNACNAVLSSFNAASLITEQYSSHEAVKVIRRQIDPEFTSRNWKPLLPGDKMPLRENQDGIEFGTSYKSLKYQVFPRAAYTTNTTVQIGSILHRPFTMEVAPQKPRTFLFLLQELNKSPFPWRVSFHFSGDGLNGYSFQSSIAKVLAFTNNDNKLFLRALEELQALKDSGETIIGLEANFTTWVNINDYPSEAEAKNQLLNQSNYFVACAQSWGNMDIREVTGDPLLPFSSTVSGLTLSTPSVKAGAPFSQALQMMPIARPTSPWDTGTLMLRSFDGKLFPIEQLSSKQASWIEIGYGGLGRGKSVHINVTNQSYILQAGLDELPYLGIIDIGPSSSGLIKLLQTALPPADRKYVAAFKMSLHEDFAINPFDTPIGCRTPFVSQVSFLVNILSVFCTPENKSEPSDGVAGFLTACIGKAYHDLAENKAKKYQAHIEPQIDEKLKHVDVKIDEYTTWWEVVDGFFEAGMYHEATLAQRHAVPLLIDIQALTNNPSMRSANFNFAEEISGQLLPDYVGRKLTEAITKYPIFRQPTKFDIGEARILSIDLNDVAPRGGAEADRQTAVMYIISLYLVSGRYFFTDEDPLSIKHKNKELQEKYRNYHVKAIKKLRRSPKKIVLDEFHRAARSGPIVSQITQSLETCTRESRKWKIAIALYSQKIEDMPQSIKDLSTIHYILGADSPETQRNLIEYYDLNSAGQSALKMLRKPDKRGSTLFAVFHTSDGVIQQPLINTIGPQQLWAFSTTSEDMNVRDELYDLVGVEKTLTALSELHPSGVKDYIVQKQNENARLGIKIDPIEDVISEVLNHIYERKI